MSRKGLNRTPRSYGYGRYIRLYGTMVWFGVNVDQFERIGNTPLWVDFIYSDITLGGAARTELGMRDANWAPVNLKRDVEYPEMLDGVVDSLKSIARVLHEQYVPRQTRVTHTLSGRTSKDFVSVVRCFPCDDAPPSALESSSVVVPCPPSTKPGGGGGPRGGPLRRLPTPAAPTIPVRRRR